MLMNIQRKISYSTSINTARKTNMKHIQEGWRVLVCLSGKRTDCCTKHNCVNQMHKHDLILYAFYVSEPFNLCCDSSDYAVGAVLTQQDNCGLERPISFISQKLTDTQRRWATIEKEAYAIVWALTKLKDVIIGSKIHIFTDHNPLTYLTESMSKSAKLVRWSLALQTFDVDVKYTKGKLNVVA